MTQSDRGVLIRGIAAAALLALLVVGSAAIGVFASDSLGYRSYAGPRFVFFENGQQTAQTWLFLVAQGPLAVGNPITTLSVGLQCSLARPVSRAEIFLFGDLVFIPAVKILNVSMPSCNGDFHQYEVSLPGSIPLYEGVANLTADLFLWNQTAETASWIASQTGGPRLVVQPAQELQSYIVARWTVGLGAFSFVLVALPAGIKTIMNLVGKPIADAWRQRTLRR